MDDNKLVQNYDKVVDSNGKDISPLDDDYSFWKSECDNRNNPLDDDFVKEDYR